MSSRGTLSHSDLRQKDFVNALDAFPSNSNALFLLGMAELEMGLLEGAVELMNKSLLLDPDFRAPYVPPARKRPNRVPLAACNILTPATCAFENSKCQHDTSPPQPKTAVRLRNLGVAYLRQAAQSSENAQRLQDPQGACLKVHG